ncbi:MAG: nuclear transport factor 2 family protein [Chitinophaga sp.]|uniref:nuclear transport factor 2 family protein n=1 Tax=Chitinophaga sp. TaxID=1869181 RepID=UPI0025B8E31D|nr:nuclear transport factor 2 family protein [Chitinophaga sp.]MBV8255550.1 nuclear transport factor 2 family protein [Chitinophaga sp.]
MYKQFLGGLFLLLAALTISGTLSAGQPKGVYVASVILRCDSLFWKAYNDCDINRFQAYLSSDVEFYHDIGGPLFGLPALTASVKNNLCKDREHFKLRREAVPGTVKVYELEKDHEVYGAVISGEHRFYITENGKPEYLSGIARFTHIWILQHGEWKMTRIISYDHQSAN